MRARRAGVDAAHAQRDVRLDRRREVGRPFEPDRPRAVVAHARHQLVRDAAIEVGRAQAEGVVPEQVLRRHGHVRLELADPDPVGPLKLEQPPRAAVDRVVEPGQLGGDALTRNFAEAAQEVLSRRASAAHRALHRRGPARCRSTCPRARRRAARSRRRAARRRAKRDRRVRLAADPRPQELRLAEPLGQLAGDAVDELAAAHVEQLGHAARHDRQVLAPLGRRAR